ncbi:MAG: sulfotransferase [Chromatiaceae bacterium]|nr:MAG: sulfotransferase [Chromatiaceae bacterium]
MAARSEAAADLPIIIGGCFRTGTSLLRRLLNSHSRIYCGPEVKFFRDFYGDYFCDPLRHLRFVASARTMLGADELLLILGSAFLEIHERAAARAGKPRWADKSPENVLYMGDWERLLGDRLRFIMMVRNPLDTLASIADAGFPLSIPGGLDERIALYERYTDAGLRFANARPDLSYVVAYEELVQAPEESLRRLMEWLGEVFEPAQLDYHRVAHQTGLEDPKVAATAGIHSASVGRGSSVFAPAEARRIMRRTRSICDAIAAQRSARKGNDRGLQR